MHQRAKHMHKAGNNSAWLQSEHSASPTQGLHACHTCSCTLACSKIGALPYLAQLPKDGKHSGEVPASTTRLASALQEVTNDVVQWNTSLKPATTPMYCFSPQVQEGNEMTHMSCTPAAVAAATRAFRPNIALLITTLIVT